MVERWALITSRILFSTCGQIEGGRGGGLLVVQARRARRGVEAVAAEVAHVLDRHDDRQIPGLLRRRRHHPDRMGPPR